jgi:hypothetical protein
MKQRVSLKIMYYFLIVILFILLIVYGRGIMEEVGKWLLWR